MTEILGPNHKPESWFADQIKDPDFGSNDLDLWNLIGQQSVSGGALPDKTAPDYHPRNTSGDIITTGMLTLINLLVFVPAGLRLGVLRDKALGTVVGWDLRAYAGNEYTDVEVRQARTAAEARWPGIEQALIAFHQLGQRIEVVEARTVESAHPQAGPTLEEMNGTKGASKPATKLSIDATGKRTRMVETPDPESGETLWCVGCNLVPIEGDLLDFEPVEVSEGGGFLCSTCAEEAE